MLIPIRKQSIFDSNTKILIIQAEIPQENKSNEITLVQKIQRTLELMKN